MSTPAGGPGDGGDPRLTPDRAVQRVILHVDMDAFFANVELVRHPELAGEPVAVGGTGRRGVIAAASYEARRFGVRSAMPTATALRACPHLVVLAGDHRHYAEVSGRVFEIFAAVTPLVEGLSLDEAFLDVTGAQRLLGEPTDIAAGIRRRTETELGLTCSVGVAANKFLAKLASEAAKPRTTSSGIAPGRGVVEIRPGEELTFLHPLPVSALWGVGPATLAKLTRLGVRTVGDLAALDRRTVVTSLGRAAGEHLHELSWARDHRAVEPDRAVKSVGHEETYATDRFTIDELHRELVRLADGVAGRLRAASVGARTLTLKVRFAGFDTITRSVTVGAPVITARAIVTAVAPLLAAIDPSPGVRLLGVSASNFTAPAEQLSFDELLAGGGAGDGAGPAGSADWTEAEATMDRIRRRYGDASIGPAAAMSRGELRVVRRGAQQWGPDA